MTKFDWSKVEKPLVLYHGGCRDGWCSAFLAKLRFQDAELVPQQYGDAAGFKLLPSEHENAAWLWVASDRVEAKT